MNLTVITRQLALLGYAAAAAENGREALDLLDADGAGIGLVITDCHMPEMDGFELTRRLRARETRSGERLPVVAATANALAGEAEKCFAAGMDDYLSKPVTVEALSRVMVRWLPHGDERPVEPARRPPPEPGASTVAASSADGVAVDLAVLTRLCGDDPEFLREMLNDFIEINRPVVESLGVAVDGTAAKQVAELAHKLKGSSGTAGAKRLAELTGALEDAGAARAWDDIHRLYPEARAEFERVIAQVESLELEPL